MIRIWALHLSLTHLSQLDLPTLINRTLISRTRPIYNFRGLGSILYVFQILIEYSVTKQ